MDITTFLQDIIPPNIDAQEFIRILRQLAFFDSIHDFWPERKTNTQAAGDDDDELIDISEDRLNIVHEKLGTNIATYVGLQGQTINNILAQTTKGAVTSISDIENRVLKYLTTNYTPFNGQTAKITFDEILRDWKFENNWNEYSMKSRSLPDNLDIIGNGRSVKSLSDTERGTLAFFMLAYMNPTLQPGSGGSTVNLTFDMSPGDIGKIFIRLSQVYNAIFPQNIADSATTSFSALQGRAQFFKADGSVGNKNVVGPSVEVKSNLFSFEKFKVEFVDKKFSAANKFGFSIVVTDRTTNAKLASIDFAPRIGEQGPPVNYLMDILASGQIEGVQPKKRTAVKLPANLYDERLLFDLKRMGDHEQMRVDNVYGVTGDRLAYAYRKLLRKPGIYHSHVGFRLFRSVDGLLDPKENALRAEQFKCSELIERVNFILNYQSQYADVNSELSKMKEHVKLGTEKCTVLMDTIDIKPADYDTRHTQVSATFATRFVRLRMQDIYSHIEKLQQLMTLINPESLRDYPAVLARVSSLTVENVDDAFKVSMDGINLTEFRIQVETAINSYEDLRKMNVVFDVNGKREPYFVELFDPVTYRLKKGVKSDIFNFSSGPYLHNETGIQVALARLLVARRARRIDAIATRVYDNLALYLQARDTAKEAFFDATTLNTVEEATDISNGLTVGQIVGLQPITEGQKNIITAINALTAPQKGGKPGDVSLEKQKTAIQEKRRAEFEARIKAKRDERIARIRSPPVLQYRDIHDLFMEICIDSETTISVDDLETKWTLGIHDIRAQALDEYNQPFEESDATDIVTFFLSFRNGIGFEPIFNLLEGNDPVYGELSRKTKGTVTIIEYIRGALLTTEERETVILNVLRKFSAFLRETPSLFEAYGTDGLNTQWSGIPTALQELVIAETGYKMGGDGLRIRRPLYTNAQTLDFPRSNTQHNPRLRERARTRRTPRVRQSTRKSKTR